MNSLKGGSSYQRKSPLQDSSGYQRHGSPLLDDSSYRTKPRSGLDDRTRSLIDNKNRANLEDSLRRTSPDSSSAYRSHSILDDSYRRGDTSLKGKTLGDRSGRGSPIDSMRKKSSLEDSHSYKRGSGLDNNFSKPRPSILDGYKSSKTDDRTTVGADSYGKAKSYGRDDSYGKGRSLATDDRRDSYGKGRSLGSDDRLDSYGKGRSLGSDDRLDSYGKGRSLGSDDRLDSYGKGRSLGSDDRLDSYGKGRSLGSDDRLDSYGKGRSYGTDDSYKKGRSLGTEDSYGKGRNFGPDDSQVHRRSQVQFSEDSTRGGRSSTLDSAYKGRSSTVDDGYTYKGRSDNSYKSKTYDDNYKSKSYTDSQDRYSASRSQDRPGASKSAYRRGYDDRAMADEDIEDDYSSQTSHQHRGGRSGKTRKRKNAVTANLSGTRYDVVRHIAEEAGFTLSKDEDPNSYLIWNDSFVSTDKITEMKSYQKINHFPGMGEVCRKDCLARNMAKMSKVYPEEYNFVPRTWIFPSEYGQFQNYAKDLKKKKKNRTFIAKPANGAMGNGICLYRNAEKIPQNDQTIVQEYLEKPLVVEGFKCDLRIYVLMTSCDPLRIFLYNDGLLRLGTEKYIHPTDHNVDHLYMHLTNYSVNKHSENYHKSGSVDTGSKRTLRFLNEYLRRNDYDVAILWRNITDLIIKTLVVAHPHVLHAYRMCRPGQPPGSDSVCFEILGFDVMLDKKLRPWLLEINRSPSFGTDEKLDYDIKAGVVEDTLRLLNIKCSDKRKNMAAQKAQAQKRLLRPSKRVDGEVSEWEKKRQSVERKKEELKELLTRMRKEASKEDFENRHCGRFKRIFPPDDKFQKEKYANLLNDAYGVFLSGRAGTLQQEIQRTYNNKLREEDVLDMLAQCEADEKEGRSITSAKAPRGPKPLQSMPSISRDKTADDDEEDEDAEDATGDAGPSQQRQNRYSNIQSRINSIGKGPRSKSTTKMPAQANQLYAEEMMGAVSQREKEEELTKRTLVALNDMRIKFPGKSDEEAEYMLDKLHENWKYHKPRVASYWLVKLDSIKRRKVTDIVRSNVRAVLQRTWKCPDIEILHLYRVFSRVFNRLLWSHGQGLWNCFQTSGNSWETIFSKSTDAISATEMACCRRIVQLCRDCLLIVYQFAADAKGAPSAGPEPDSSPRLTRGGAMEMGGSSQLISQRLSRLYQQRSSSLNNLYGPS